MVFSDETKRGNTQVPPANPELTISKVGPVGVAMGEL